MVEKREVIQKYRHNFHIAYYGNEDVNSDVYLVVTEPDEPIDIFSGEIHFSNLNELYDYIESYKYLKEKALLDIVIESSHYQLIGTSFKVHPEIVFEEPTYYDGKYTFVAIGHSTITTQLLPIKLTIYATLTLNTLDEDLYPNTVNLYAAVTMDDNPTRYDYYYTYEVVEEHVEGELKKKL
jgi:hypothetical protein